MESLCHMGATVFSENRTWVSEQFAEECQQSCKANRTWRDPEIRRTFIVAHGVKSILCCVKLVYFSLGSWKFKIYGGFDWTFSGNQLCSLCHTRQKEKGIYMLLMANSEDWGQHFSCVIFWVITMALHRSPGRSAAYCLDLIGIYLHLLLKYWGYIYEPSCRQL